MTQTWSERIAEAFGLQVPADLRAWLDDGVWQQGGGAEFCRPLSPDQILQPEPGAIWGGFMLPDTLPLISNHYGDWLCLRLGMQGELIEVVYWCHAGGDWIPYGRTLSEALIYDAAFRVLYNRRFAELSEPDRPVEEVFRPASWACQLREATTGKSIPRFWLRDAPDNLPRLLLELLDAGVSEVATRRDLILWHLESQLKTRSAPAVARQIGAVWEPDFVSWLFDAALLPELTRVQLSQLFHLPADQLTFQDWDAAEAEALMVGRSRHDLGWPFDIAGWAAERRGDTAAAIGQYLRGLRASAFSDDSVRFRTHWFGEGFGKFSAARLHALRDQLTDEQQQDPYLQMFWKNDPESLRSRVRDYWIGRAEQAMSAGRFRDAYCDYYAAGWDLGLQYVKSYEELLEQLATAAERAGSSALARVARMHAAHL